MKNKFLGWPRDNSLIFLTSKCTWLLGLLSLSLSLWNAQEANPTNTIPLKAFDSSLEEIPQIYSESLCLFSASTLFFFFNRWKRLASLESLFWFLVIGLWLWRALLNRIEPNLTFFVIVFYSQFWIGIYLLVFSANQQGIVLIFVGFVTYFLVLFN